LLGGVMLKRFYFSGSIILFFSFLFFFGCEKKGTETKPDFTLKITPTSRIVAKGDSINFAVKILPVKGFNSDVTLGLSGLPQGGSGIFEDSILSPSDSTTLWIKTTPSIAVRTDTLTLTASGGGKSHSTNLSLNVVLKISELTLYFQKIDESRTLRDSAGTFISQERILNDTLVWNDFFMNQNFSFDTAYFYLYFYLYRETLTPLATIHMQIQSGGQTLYDADVHTLPEGIIGGTDTFDTLRVVFFSTMTFYSGEEIEITLRAQGYTNCIFKYGGTPYDSYVRFY
jgi:hypothetical protein